MAYQVNHLEPFIYVTVIFIALISTYVVLPNPECGHHSMKKWLGGCRSTAWLWLDVCAAIIGILTIRHHVYALNTHKRKLQYDVVALEHWLDTSSRLELLLRLVSSGFQLIGMPILLTTYEFSAVSLTRWIVYCVVGILHYINYRLYLYLDVDPLVNILKHPRGNNVQMNRQAPVQNDAAQPQNEQLAPPPRYSLEGH